MKIIQQGAEAVIYLNKKQIIKQRIKKSYRQKELDLKLRKSRTKSEAKLLEKSSKFITVPKLLKTDNKEKIMMEYIDGKKLSDNLENLNWKKICEKIGKILTKLHNQNIIHGDLTTSNMILKNNEIYLIDFGLGFHSMKIEDKAVDLHLLKQALNAKHFRIADECFKIILKNYKPEKYSLILDRIPIIESRGRYKNKH